MQGETLFYDLGTHPCPEGSSSPSRMALAARRLGYAGVCARWHQDYYPGQAKLPEGVLRGVEIVAANANELRRGIDRYRGRADVLAVHGGDEAINRAACEDGRVDVLAHPHEGGKASGINHIVARLAADRGVAVEFSLFPLIHHRGGSRVRALSSYRTNFALVRKYDVPYIITSGAMSHYDLRDVRSAIALCRLFGMGEKDAIRGLSGCPSRIIGRAVPGHVMDGVEIVESPGRGQY
jgi:ribonuclease P/MRP protein subunit RPP1